MPFAKGNNANPLGRRAEQPFQEALRVELAAAGSDHKALRRIARNLIGLAQKRTFQAMPAISAIADRLDGKPVQQNTVTMIKRDASDWSRAELVEFLQRASHQLEDQRQAEERELKTIEAQPIETVHNPIEEKS